MAATTSTAPLDLWVQGEGTIFLVWPRSAAGEAWLEDHVEPNAMHWGSATVVEHRFVSELVNGALDDGLKVGGS